MNTRVHQGHFARKRFGQNFLTDQFIIDSIVASINPQPGQAIVEIGPGLAALTEPVADRMDKMTVIEIDRSSGRPSVFTKQTDHYSAGCHDRGFHGTGTGTRPAAAGVR